MGVSERLEKLKKEFYRANGEKANLENQKIRQEQDVEELTKKSKETGIMKQLLEKASEEARENGKQVLSETSSNAIQMVWDDNMEVDMNIQIKRGVPNADLFIRQTSDGHVLETDPAQEEGGGLADIVSASTFMSLGMLVGDNNKAPYFLDEPTKYVSKGNSDNVAKFLKEIVDYSQKQTILITHDSVIAESGDKVFKVVKDVEGTSSVSEVVR